jgi:hypothetical protein
MESITLIARTGYIPHKNETRLHDAAVRHLKLKVLACVSEIKDVHVDC